MKHRASFMLPSLIWEYSERLSIKETRHSQWRSIRQTDNMTRYNKENTYIAYVFSTDSTTLYRV